MIEFAISGFLLFNSPSAAPSLLHFTVIAISNRGGSLDYYLITVEGGIIPVELSFYLLTHTLWWYDNSTQYTF